MARRLASLFSFFFWPFPIRAPDRLILCMVAQNNAGYTLPNIPPFMRYAVPRNQELVEAPLTPPTLGDPPPKLKALSPGKSH